MNNTKNHKLYTLCESAYRNTSFSPDKRAESEVAFYEEILAEFAVLCAGDSERLKNLTEKFTSKFTAHMHAKSRCISSMITGPAKFPTRRAEKANESEHKRGNEVLEFIEKVRKVFDKEKNPHKHGISSDAPDAIQLLKDKLAKLEKNQEDMKNGNKILRNKKIDNKDKAEQLIALGFSERLVKECLEPDFCGRYGFPPYMLSNNNANIKTTKQRIESLESKQDKENIEQVIKGVRVLTNYDDNRYQLFFDGKPAQEVIKELKSHGMKWSRTNECWQRMITGNARFSIQCFFQKYQQVDI